MANVTPGNVVQLKSGGPLMTVSKLDGEKAWCYWMLEGEKKVDAFPVVTLVEVQ